MPLPMPEPRLPPVVHRGNIMCREKQPEKAESNPKAKVKSSMEQEENQKQNTDEGAAAPPAVDLTAQIVENNKDLTAQITNAINLTISISSLTPGVSPGDPAPGLANLEQLVPGLPGSGGTTNNSAATAALGAAAPAALPPTEAPLQSSTSGAPLSGQELGLLSLLNSTSNFLTPSEMALPLNDPSVFLPTPFAPGQNANTLQHDQVSAPGPPVATPIAPIAPAIPVAPLPVAIPTVPQQQLLQHLAVAYAAGRQPMFPPGAAMGGAIPPPFMNGLAPTNNILMGVPPVNPMDGDLNLLGVAGIPALLNPGIAGWPAVFDPRLAGLNLAGMAPLAANMGTVASQQPPITDSSALLPQDNHQNTINDALAAFSRQSSSLVQNELNQLNTKSPTVTSSADVKMAEISNLPEVNIASQEHPKSGKKSKKTGGDPLIKSREARWIIRYNELLEFRREHGHCRVPHGYDPNRKLSWWVMNQRAQFAHRNQGKKTWLSADRIQLLNDIGFIWTPHLKKLNGNKKRGSASSCGEEEDEPVEDCSEKDKDKSHSGNKKSM